MSRVRFETVDVFTDRRFGGNQLAVCPNASGISDQDMQRLAAEFNLSETTFVLPPADPSHTARVRIFNRSHEMPFAGHPMVGTAFVLARSMSAEANTLTFEVPAGLVAVQVNRRDGVVTGATIEAPQPLTLGLELSPSVIAPCVDLVADDFIVANHAPVVVSTGNTYMAAEVAADALDRAVPDINMFRQVRDAHAGFNGRFSLYLYAHRDGGISSRMFAPLVGTYEDPATGSAATPVAALLLKLSGNERHNIEIHQGVKMGRPSALHASAWKTLDGIRASVGGNCVPVLSGEATLD